MRTEKQHKGRRESDPFDRASARAFETVSQRQTHHRFAISYRLVKEKKDELLASRMSPIELPPPHSQ